MKASTQDLYEGLCAALRRPLSQASPALISSLKDQDPEDIGVAMRRMTGDEATLLFNWLDDDRALAALGYLTAEMTDYILRHAPPGRIASLDVVSALPSIDEAGYNAEEG